MSNARWDGPTRGQVARVADAFEQLAGCGTSACHAGWYSVHVARTEGRGTHGSPWLWRTHDGPCAQDARPSLQRLTGPAAHHWRWVSHGDGARRMAQDLGFPGWEALVALASAHREWWGNAHAGDMFRLRSAFGVAAHEPIGLGDIARHWRGVAGRTPE